MTIINHYMTSHLITAGSCVTLANQKFHQTRESIASEHVRA